MIENHITRLSEETFNNHMNAAQCFPDSDYKTGYVRGVERLYTGESYCTAEDHENWLHLSGTRQALGDGYRDGFAGKMFDFTRLI